MSTTTEIKLEQPGAGLPLVQKIFLRLYLGPIKSKKTASSDVRKNYEKLTQKIIDKVALTTEEQRTKKILIDPIPGLEDSSRLWSINDTLEHIIIVSLATQKNILLLCQNIVPDIVVDTAKVKPNGVNENIFEQFLKLAPNLLQTIDNEIQVKKLNFNSKAKLKHPWFGPFIARQWYWMLSSHQGIHYQQIKKIIEKL